MSWWPIVRLVRVRVSHWSLVIVLPCSFSWFHHLLLTVLTVIKWITLRMSNTHCSREAKWISFPPQGLTGRLICLTCSGLLTVLATVCPGGRLQCLGPRFSLKKWLSWLFPNLWFWRFWSSSHSGSLSLACLTSPDMWSSLLASFSSPCTVEGAHSFWRALSVFFCWEVFWTKIPLLLSVDL